MASFFKNELRDVPSMDDLIIRDRVQHLEGRRRRMARRVAWPVDSSAKPVLFYGLSRAKREDRRLVLSFVTQTLFWGRLLCKKCGSRLTYIHMMDCANARAAQDWCKIGKFKKAASYVRMAVQTCRPDDA